MTAPTHNGMGWPKMPQVNNHGRGTWERRLRDNRKRQTSQTKPFLLETMKETEARYVSYLKELDALDAEYEAALTAAEKSQTTRPDVPEQKKKPVSHDTYHETPYGRAREGADGQLFIYSPKPVHDRWSAWCAAHWDEYLKHDVVGTYLYAGPVITDEGVDT